jgi:HPr kinase/phosphorylase
MFVHATCIDLAGAGVLIVGPSGSGKSDLALRLVAAGAWLVSDDQCDLWVKDGLLWARAPQRIDGLIEVRGVGILTAPRKSATVLRLAVELTAVPVPRLPEARAWATPDASWPRLPRLLLDGRDGSAPEKVRFMLAHLAQGTRGDRVVAGGLPD